MDHREEVEGERKQAHQGWDPVLGASSLGLPGLQGSLGVGMGHDGLGSGFAGHGLSFGQASGMNSLLNVGGGQPGLAPLPSLQSAVPMSDQGMGLSDPGLLPPGPGLGLTLPGPHAALPFSGVPAWPAASTTPPERSTPSPPPTPQPMACTDVQADVQGDPPAILPAVQPAAQPVPLPAVAEKPVVEPKPEPKASKDKAGKQRKQGKPAGAVKPKRSATKEGKGGKRGRAGKEQVPPIATPDVPLRLPEPASGSPVAPTADVLKTAAVGLTTLQSSVQGACSSRQRAVVASRCLDVTWQLASFILVLPVVLGWEVTHVASVRLTGVMLQLVGMNHTISAMAMVFSLVGMTLLLANTAWASWGSWCGLPALLLQGAGTLLDRAPPAPIHGLPALGLQHASGSWLGTLSDTAELLVDTLPWQGTLFICIWLWRQALADLPLLHALPANVQWMLAAALSGTFTLSALFSRVFSFGAVLLVPLAVSAAALLVRAAGALVPGRTAPGGISSCSLLLILTATAGIAVHLTPCM